MSSDLPPGATCFDASALVATWDETRRVLLDAFAASQPAAQAEASIVYIVHGDDLLGRRGAPSAMVGTGILSAARTAAIELSRKGAVVNVIAIDDETDPEITRLWVSYLVDGDGPTGQVVQLTKTHLGKALP
ncbi:hypothetical protein BH23ACT5_BH23ACT5_23640 [soil metagenome]